MVMFWKIEEELRGKINMLSQKMFTYEQQMRSKDEELYNVKKENQALITDLKNLAGLEQA